MSILTLYAVCTSDQTKWYRSRNVDPYTWDARHNSCWTEKIENAKIYGKIGPARALVTKFARLYPDYPILTLVQLDVGHAKYLIEGERVRKALHK